MQIKDRTLCLVVALLCSATAAQSAGIVTIAPVVNGIVAVDNSSPAPGDVVTLTVTPDVGYMIAKADITAEATITPGAAQAPALGAPSVGYLLPLQGDQPDDTSVEASYTFEMPEEPYNVLITARFTAQSHTALHDPAVQPAVAHVHYVDLAGRVSQAPHAGINVVVSTLTDGTRTVTRMVR